MQKWLVGSAVVALWFGAACGSAPANKAAAGGNAAAAPAAAGEKGPFQIWCTEMGPNPSLGICEPKRELCDGLQKELVASQQEWSACALRKEGYCFIIHDEDGTKQPRCHTTADACFYFRDRMSRDPSPSTYSICYRIGENLAEPEPVAESWWCFDYGEIGLCYLARSLCGEGRVRVISQMNAPADQVTACRQQDTVYCLDGKFEGKGDVVTACFSSAASCDRFSYHYDTSAGAPCHAQK